MQIEATQGQRIRQMRLECRYTQEYVAAQLGTTKQAIYKYEADLIKNIPTDKLIRLSHLFQCSPSWLQALSNERGVPYGTEAAPSDQLARAASVAEDASSANAEDVITFYRDFMDILLHLTPAERYTIMQFSQFLLSKHEQPQE